MTSLKKKKGGGDHPHHRFSESGRKARERDQETARGNYSIKMKEASGKERS